MLAKHNVAIDAEEANRAVNLRLAEKILSPDEKAQFEAAEDKRTALLTFWVLKECAAKLSGEGLRGYPNHTNFSLKSLRKFHFYHYTIDLSPAQGAKSAPPGGR